MQTAAKKTYKSMAYIFGFVLNACLGGFYFGYIMGELNLCLLDLKHQYGWDDDLSNVMKGVLNALGPVGAIVGVLISGQWLGKVGRKWSLIIADVIGVIGCVLCLFLASSGSTQIVGRLLSGVSMGINSQIIPIYINELTPIEVSGTMGTFFQSFINVGILVSYIMGLGIPNEDSNNKGNYDLSDKWWIFVFAFPIITSFFRVLMLLTVFNFDTPFSLLKNGAKTEEVKTVMRKIYHEEFIDDVLTNIKNKISDYKDVSYGTLFKVYTNRVVVGLLLMVTQQVCGINAVVTDSSTLYSSGGRSDSTVKMLTIINSIVLFLAAFVSGKFSDMKGRRTMLMGGTGFCCIVLLVLGVMQTPGISNDAMNNASIGLTMLFLFSFGISLGPIAWVYEPEILPEKGIGLCTITNWVFCCLVVLLTPIVSGTTGIAPVYYFFGGCCFASLLYMLPMLKETKGLSSKEIDQIFGTVVPNELESEKSNNGLTTDNDSQKALL